MNTPPPVPPAHPAGYLSEENKKRYTMIVGVCAAVFFVAQFIVPMAVWFSAMPLIMTTQIAGMKQINAEGAASWNGATWYIEESISGSRGRQLMKQVKDAEDPAAVLKINSPDAALLPDGDRLWVVASDSVSIIREGQDTVTYIAETGGTPCHPFLYNGSPSHFERRPDGIALVSFDAQTHEWSKIAGIPPLAANSQVAWDLDDVMALASGSSLHLFFDYGSKIYYQKAVPGQTEQLSSTWKAVADSKHSKWDAAMANETPLLFIGNPQDSPFNPAIECLALQDGSFKELFTVKAAFMGDFSVIATDGISNATIIAESMPGTFRVMEFANGELTSNTRYGKSSFPFGKGTMLMMMAPYSLMWLSPFILAFIFSALMRRYRILDYAQGSQTVRYASLAKRAVSQIIDALIAGLPAGIGYILMMSTIFDFERFITSPTTPWFFLGNFALIFAGLGWGLICFFAYVFCEGKWGTTPGKWMTGIRVIGTDLKPCGFGRAFLRGLLKFVDGFFSFMVGVMVIALTADCQRVGDMAARTIVIDIRAQKQDA